VSPEKAAAEKRAIAATKADCLIMNETPLPGIAGNMVSPLDIAAENR
jgi:hypothetical protein